MIVICPSCRARFDVDASEIGPQGRTVRCSQCGRDWLQQPEATELEEAGGAPKRRHTRPGGSQRRPRRSYVWLAALSLLLLVAVALTARQQIIDTVPAAAGLYARLGFATGSAARDLSLQDVTSVRRMVEGKRLLIVHGWIENLADAERPVPRLQASLTDDDGKELMSWRFTAKHSLLGPGQRTSFTTSSEDPPRTGASLAIKFVAND